MRGKPLPDRAKLDAAHHELEKLIEQMKLAIRDHNKAALHEIIPKYQVSLVKHLDHEESIWIPVSEEFTREEHLALEKEHSKERISKIPKKQLMNLLAWMLEDNMDALTEKYFFKKVLPLPPRLIYKYSLKKKYATFLNGLIA